MPIFYWNPLSIDYLIEAILIGSIVVYLFSRLIVTIRTRLWARETGLLFFTFLASEATIVLQLLATSVHPNYADYFLPWVGPAGATAMGGSLMFAFYFQRKPTASRWSEIVLIALLVALVSLEMFIAIERCLLLSDGFVEYREAWVDIPFTVGFLAAFLFLFLRLAKLLSEERNVSVLSGLSLALLALMGPWISLSREASAVRAFFYVSTMSLLIGLVLLSRSFGLIDWTVALVLTVWVTLLTFSGFALVYLNHVPEQSSFQVKLVGITLVSILLILSGVSWVVGNVYTEAYQSSHYLDDQTAILFEPTSARSYSARQTDFSIDDQFGTLVEDPSQPVSLPFQFPYYGQGYDQIFIRNAGMVGFDGHLVWRDILHQYGPQPAIFLVAADLQVQQQSNSADAVLVDQSGLFINRTQTHTTLTWNRLVSVFHPDEEYSFQLKLFPSGALEMIFIDVPEVIRSEIFTAHSAPLMMGIVPGFEGRLVSSARFESSLPHHGAPGEGIIEFHRGDFLEYLNRIYEPIAYFILGSSLLVFLILPQFFRINLDRPLKQLLNGVRNIMGGKLTTSIKVQHRDEIGYLASSFNEMAKAQDNLIQSLEDKVSARTSEATEYAAKNARLEERNHLSRELHDAVSQTLFSANLIADTLPDLQKGEPDDLNEAVAEIRRLNKDALVEMRNLLLELRPEKLSEFPFGHLLKSIVETVEDNFSVQIVCTIESDVALPGQVQLAFYRTAQECLTNAAKHANAIKVEVYFDGVQGQALLSIKDNGSGFETENIPPGRMGLHFMRERMAEIGGTVTVQSDPGNGTTVEAIWFENERT